jgi:hypothetical protein
MFGGFSNPIQALPVTIVTPQVIIEGMIQTRLHRLTDILNESDEPHLVIADATFLEVGSRRVLASAAIAQVQLAEILFVHTNGPTDSPADMRVPRQAVRATLVASPFTIEGLIYLAYEQDLRMALDAYGGRFLPVTGARYWANGGAEPPRDVDLLVVNHARAHVAVAAGVEWLTEAPPDDEAGSGPNPW